VRRTAAFAAGLELTEMTEGLIDETWIAKRPSDAKHRNQPVSFCRTWRKAGWSRQMTRRLAFPRIEVDGNNCPGLRAGASPGKSGSEVTNRIGP